jgi:hypothetical protein
VGWQFAGHMRTTLVLGALRMALHQRGPGADVQLVHHSDHQEQDPERVPLLEQAVLQGPLEPGQYTSGEYTQTLQDAGVLGSIGTVGDALDSARGVLRGLIQDQADRRPRLAQSHASIQGRIVCADGNGPGAAPNCR